MPPQPPFERLVPTSSEYAILPVSLAFTWDAVADAETAGEWYLVAFRSVRAPDADETLLTELDERAHREAADSPGFVHYFKGPANDRGECLSFCLWQSRALARAAAGQPAHARAVAITHETYASYTLEFHRVTKRAGETRFEIEPFDREPARASAGRSRDADASAPLEGTAILSPLAGISPA
ncbi:MAG TPA: hypothetical protein VEY67_05285 [Candidatus Dormibacteraeota bacterium]|nr:hypothetical protein [Candidatus Dormibacteraeota bacterium]